MRARVVDFGPNQSEAIAVAVGQRTEQHAIDDAEYGDVRAGAERERQDSRDGERRRFGERANRVAEHNRLLVSQRDQRIDPRGPPRRNQARSAAAPASTRTRARASADRSLDANSWLSTSRAASSRRGQADRHAAQHEPRALAAAPSGSRAATRAERHADADFGGALHHSSTTSRHRSRDTRAAAPARRRAWRASRAAVRGASATSSCCSCVITLRIGHRWPPPAPRVAARSPCWRTSPPCAPRPSSAPASAPCRRHRETAATGHRP